MSNFQRTRSKVWWGDAQPNIGSPVAQQNINHHNDDWEPQLPHWIANEPEPQRNNSADNIAQPNNAVNQWPLRHGSPGSHKSQDSGFSDSDSSPPPSQYYPSPEDVKSNKSSSSSDSNNNQNITVKQAIDFKNTPHRTDDQSVNNNNNTYGIPTPKPRLRIGNATPKIIDLQKYYDYEPPKNELVDIDKNDNETNKANIKFDSNDKSKGQIHKNNTKTNLSKSHTIEIKVSPPNDNKENRLSKSAIQLSTKDESPKNSNIISPSKKYPVKNFASNKDSKHVSNVDIVKDVEISSKSEESLINIKLADDNEIAVNNQPRIRSPISNISYVPTERTSSTQKTAYRRSISTEENLPISTTPTFQRNRLNKSLNYEGQNLDQQILDTQDNYHSLGFINNDMPVTNDTEIDEIHKPTKAILGKNIMDSLNLRPIKKMGPKFRQRTDLKQNLKESNSPFRIFQRKEKPGIVDSHAGGVLEGSRVPSLGLPRSSDHNNWVVVTHPEKEMLIPHYNERLIGTENGINQKPKDPEVEEKPITPPPEFQDNVPPYETDTKSEKDLTNDSKREKLKLDFADVQLDLACSSTPKMLAPHEYMNVKRTPRNAKKILKDVLQESFTGLVLDRDELLYRERSIDQTPLERLCDSKPEAVQYWLCDLIGSCENECMTTLQSKPLGTEMKAMVSASSATITGNIKKVQTHGQIIVHQYSDVLRQMETQEISEDQICLLVANINEFVLAHSITLNTKPPGESPERWDKIKVSLQTYLQRLIDIGEDVKMELNESCPEWKLVERHLEALIDIFLETTKAVLVQQMKTLVSLIEEPPSDLILKGTLTSIGHLAMLTETTSSSLHKTCAKIIRSITDLPFVDCGVPRALLIAIIETNKSSIKALSLRALATICVTGDAVKQFEEGGGIEILSDILSDDSNPEPQKREAITVLTQITAPWLRGHYDLTQLHLYLNNIVQHITEILYRTECCQLLLLCTACLVNLVRELELERKEDIPTTSTGDIVELITKHKTVEKLLDAVKKRGPSMSVFLQEQTASLLSSLSRISRCVLPLSRIPSVTAALVSFTRWPPAHNQRVAETRAQVRLHSHAAEALSRLSVIPDISHQIVKLEGVTHLIRLVKMQRDRKHYDTNPDQTLIHCLKTLRTIYKNSTEAFNGYSKDVDDMIRPHLMESLMKFSAKQESYV